MTGRPGDPPVTSADGSQAVGPAADANVVAPSVADPATGRAPRSRTPRAPGQEGRLDAATAQMRLQLQRPSPDPIGDPPDTVSAWNIANALTVFRLALVPVFVVALFAAVGHDLGWRVLAWAVFAVASITDRIDGDLARKRNLVTEFGKLADPIADKALIGAALIGLSVLGDLPWWVTVVVLARELGVTLLRFWVIRHGVIPASRGGKLKTLLQAVAIGLYVLPPIGVVAAARLGDHVRRDRGGPRHRRRLRGARRAAAPRVLLAAPRLTPGPAASRNPRSAPA